METSIGSAELRLLRYLAEHGPMTVRAAHDGFGEPAGVVRTTVQQMMERLRRKGLLSRSEGPEGYLYAAVAAPQDIARSAVHQFVTQALGGSLTPLVSYLAEQQTLSDEARRELQDLLDQLKEDAP